MKLLDKAPLMRIVLPFAAGILLSEWFHADKWIIWGLLAVTFSCMICVRLFSRKRPATISYSIPLQSFCVMMAATMTGWLSGLYATPSKIDLGIINESLVVARIDKIETKYFSTLAEATISVSFNDESTRKDVEIPVRLSIQGNDYTLVEGDWIAFKAALQPIKSLGNPDEFDYATYMKHRSILYSQFLKRDEYAKIETSSGLMTIARKCQRSLINQACRHPPNASCARFCSVNPPILTLT